MISGGAFAEIVRVYADRVHDDVRRLGVPANAAVEIVEESVLDVLAGPAPETVPAALGAWFRNARELALRVGGDDDATDVTGLIGDTDDERSAREALAARPADERQALLLRDSYDLPYAAVAAALGLDAGAAARLVARARLRLAGMDVPAGHDAELARLVDGEPSRHAAHCETCRTAEPAMRESRRRIGGLAILALPDAERDTILERVTEAAHRTLPSDEEVAARLAALDARAVRPSPVTVAGSLAGALLLGAVMGVVTSGGGGGGGNATGAFGGEPSPTPSVTSFSPTPSASATTQAPSPTATATATPSETSSPTPTSTATSAPPLGSERMTITPQSGPNCTRITVRGTNWRARSTVRISYRDLTGTTEHAMVSTTAGDDGRFKATIRACDPALIPGPHLVRATSGARRAEQTFTATS